MNCKPFYLYEREGLCNRNNLGISVQCVLTNRGRICFCAMAEGVKQEEKDETIIAMVLQEVTQWFYETGIPAFCKSNSKNSLYRSLKREFFMLHQKLLLHSAEHRFKCKYSLQVLIITESGYLGCRVGDGNWMKCKGKKYKLLQKEKEKKIHFLGEEERLEIERVSGKNQKDTLYLLFSKACASHFSKKHLCSFVYSARKEESVKKVLKELMDRNRERYDDYAYACICVRTEE